jgi:hypothetical protein
MLVIPVFTKPRDSIDIFGKSFLNQLIRRSSNGRTTGSGSVNRGSIPCLRANVVMDLASYVLIVNKTAQAPLLLLNPTNQQICRDPLNINIVKFTL